MILLIQQQVIETAKDLLNTNDATVVGFSLVVLAGSWVVIYALWKKINKLQEYITSQDKANLEMMMNVTNTITSVAETSSNNGSKLDDINIKASSLITIIKERLNK